MSKFLTSEQIAKTWWRDPRAKALAATARALAQRLADSPCPVCTIMREDDVGVGSLNFMEACPHCGDFPPDRKGKAYPTPEAAIDSLPKGAP